MAKDFLEEVKKEQEILDIGMKESLRAKAERMERFPTAEERWPRAGIVMTKRVFLIGNGESRKDFDLLALKPHGKLYACNAFYRDNPGVADALIAVDATMTHEIYHKGIAQTTDCYFREWTKVPNFMYDTMLQGMLHTQDKDKADSLITNGASGNYFVMNAHTIKGEATIRKENDERYKKQVDNAHVYVSWTTETDRVKEFEDPGYCAGATSGYIACQVEKPDEVYLLGQDLISDTKLFNNMYKGSKNYSSAHYEPSPTGIWEREWLQLMQNNPKIKFIKVNKALDDLPTNQKIQIWDNENLEYITQAQLLDKMSKW